MKCFCGNEMTQMAINSDAFYSCSHCGFLRKIVLPTRDKEKERYDHHICDSGYVKYMQGVYEKIEKYILGECLDFGCGQIHALANIIEENGGKCDYYDLYYYPELLDKKYDTIILIEVFEHIADVFELMKDLKARLKDNGRIVIMTQKKKYPLEKWWYIRDITHVSFVDFTTMEFLAALLDFKLIEEDGFFVFQ